MVIGSTRKLKIWKKPDIASESWTKVFNTVWMSTPTNTLVNGQLWRFTFKAGTQACEERREERGACAVGWDERAQTAEGGISNYRAKHGIDWLVSAQSWRSCKKLVDCNGSFQRHVFLNWMWCYLWWTGLEKTKPIFLPFMSFPLAENFSSLGTVSGDTNHAQDTIDNIKKIERQSIDDFFFLIFIISMYLYLPTKNACDVFITTWAELFKAGLR